MPESHHRRTYLVDRPFQLKYIFLLAGWGLVLAVLCGAWAWQAHRQAVEMFARDAERQALLGQVDRSLAWALIGVGVLSTAALGLLGFVITHRVAGPIWVMGHSLGELARGRYPARRGLRRGDELKSFHARFHEAVQALAERDRRTLLAMERVLQALPADARRAPGLAEAALALEAEARERREALATLAPPAA